MELDDLKNSWHDLNSQLQKRPSFSTEMIDQITRKKYYTTIKQIAYPEIAGVIICLISVIFLILNFSKLDTPFLEGTGILSALLLLTLPVLSLTSLWQLKLTGDVDKPYTETLRKFAIQKIRFYKLQRFNITLSYLLLVTILILMSKLFGGKDISDNKYFWILSFPIGYLFLSFYSKWVWKYYKKTLQQSEELLKELEA